MQTEKLKQSRQPWSPEPAGWAIRDWCMATNISRASFYLLAVRPGRVKLGRRTIVIESPQDYLHRIAELSEAARKAA